MQELQKLERLIAEANQALENRLAAHWPVGTETRAEVTASQRGTGKTSPVVVVGHSGPFVVCHLTHTFAKQERRVHYREMR